MANHDDELYQHVHSKMTTEQEHLFMTNHYSHLKEGVFTYKFVIDLDKVLEDAGITRRANAKRILVKRFTENVDYKIAPQQFADAPKEKGKIKETVLLTVDCFECFCFWVKNTKAKDLRDFYIKVTGIIRDYTISKYYASQRKYAETQRKYAETKRKFDEEQRKLDALRSEPDMYENTDLIRARIERKKLDMIASIIPLCKNYDEVMNVLNKLIPTASRV
jgi:hypothetical protein